MLKILIMAIVLKDIFYSDHSQKFKMIQLK